MTAGRRAAGDATRDVRAAQLVDGLLKIPRSLGAIPLTPAAILRAAERTTGLPDLHPKELAEPLELLCDDLARHPPSALGAFAVRTIVGQGLASRIRMQHAPSWERGLPPVVVLGWYRTGTTFLQSVLSALPGYGHVPMHRLAQPVEQRGQRLRAAFGTRLMAHLAPEIARLHRVTADDPEECWLLLAMHLVVDGFAVHWDVPSYAAWLRRVDRGPVYATWAKSLGLLERDLGHGLVLKDPAHLLALPALTAAAPDARIVWTHRDPVSAITSYARLVAAQHQLIYGVWDPHRAGRTSLDRMAYEIGRGLETRPSGVCDVSSRELRDDPVGAVERVCLALDLPFDADRIARRVRDISTAPTEKGQLSTWGLDEQTVRERMSFYELPGASSAGRVASR